uniref:Serpin domain-containing protein n=1 Tax=Glossina brevipalpis TaxID=37001 RepID=A0A1A9WR87_9MUSC
MASNAYFKQQQKCSIVLLILNGFALFAVNSPLLVKASGISAEYEKFSESFFYEENQHRSEENIVIPPFAMQSFEALIKLGFCDEPELPDENFNEIMNEVRKSNSVRMNYDVYIPEGSELAASTLAIIEKAFPTTFKYVDESNSWMMDAIQAHLNNLKWFEEITGAKQTPSGTLVQCDTNVTTDWLKPFDPKHTKDGEFHTENAPITVPFMHQEGTYRMCERDDLNAKIIEMPLNDENLAMWVYLPKEKDGMDELEEKLKIESLTNIDSSMNEQQVEVRLPKFHDSFEMDLDQELAKTDIEYALSNTGEKTEAKVERPIMKLRTNIAMTESLDSEEHYHIMQRDVAGAPELPSESAGCAEFDAAHPFIYHLVHKDKMNGQILPIIIGSFKNLNININLPK